MRLERILVAGAGPAGSAAALTLAAAGLAPELCERSSFPRHKVCGEFLSPEIQPLLEKLGVAEGFLALGPARITYAELQFGRARRRFRLPEPAWGLSRFALDDYLARSARLRGATWRRESVSSLAAPAVWAGGRRVRSPRGARVFGFKAHFRGPAQDAVELYFFPGGYCGLAPIEGGATNVCGLASEEALRSAGFTPDRLLAARGPVGERIRPLERVSEWRLSGPLRFGHAIDAPRSLLVAGDAGCFVDPFTGSGLLAAMQTGIWAGEALVRAAEGARWEDCCAWHRRLCGAFHRRLLVAGVIVRRALELGVADVLSSLLPGPALFRWTRPKSGNRR